VTVTFRDGAATGRRAAGWLVAAALAAALPSAVEAQLFTDTESRKAIAAQRETIAAQQQQIADLARQSGELSTRINQLENALKAQSLLEVLNQIEALQAEMRKLRGQQEVLANAIETAVRRQRDMYIDLDSRIKRVEAAAAAPAAPAAPPAAVPTPGSGSVPGGAPTAAPGPGPGSVVLPGAATSTVAPVSTPTTSTPPASAPTTATPTAPDALAEQRAYDSAHQLRRIGNYAGAISAFQAFVKAWPKSRLAPAAQYWIGDSHFNLREYRVAISSQRQLIATWPDNEKVPDALLNIASSQAELGESAAARRTLEDLVARHPKSEAADRAKRRLAARK